MRLNTPKLEVKIPAGTLLVLLFTTLKLAGAINWSWAVVTAPIWIPVAFLGFAAIICAIGMLIISIYDRIFS